MHATPLLLSKSSHLEGFWTSEKNCVILTKHEPGKGPAIVTTGPKSHNTTMFRWKYERNYPATYTRASV